MSKFTVTRGKHVAKVVGATSSDGFLFISTKVRAETVRPATDRETGLWGVI